MFIKGMDLLLLGQLLLIVLQQICDMYVWLSYTWLQHKINKHRKI